MYYFTYLKPSYTVRLLWTVHPPDKTNPKKGGRSTMDQILPFKKPKQKRY